MTPEAREDTRPAATVPPHARAVIIGGGAAGASVAYHLSRRWSDIVLLEKGVLSCGTTWHSAGDIPLMKPTPLIGLVRYGADLYSRLEEETGLSVGWRNCGYIKVARTVARFSDYKRSVSTFNALGGAAEVISPARVREIWPLANVDDLVGAVWEPGSGRVDPTGLVHAYIKGARSRGVRVVENCPVTKILTEHGRVTGVATSAGTITCDVVINCAGIWARHIGALAGVNVPLHATEHFYMLTKPIEGIHRKLPILNDPDGNVYMREDVGGLLVGCFEPGAKPLKIESLPSEFSFGRLEEDWEHVTPYMINATQRVPALETAEIRMLMNGPESFTPDGGLLIGEAPELERFYVLAGFNSGGVAMSAGMGRVISEWVVDGEPGEDMSRYDIRRFGEITNNTPWLAARVTEIVGRHMAVPAPGKDYATGRPQRQSPFYEFLAARGAQCGSLMGWERPLWYGKPEPALEDPFEQPWWLRHSAEEHRGARERVALFDLTSFAKIAITGRDSLAFVQRLFNRNMDVAPGRAVYTMMLNEQAGIESDLTVIRTGERDFLVITGASQGVRDLDWLRKHCDRRLRVGIVEVTSSFAVLGLMGPRSREVLQKLTDTDMSNAAFPFMGARTISVAGARVLAVRASFAGALGWELYIPADAGRRVIDGVWSVGEPFGLQCAGYNALGSLRMEKQYRSWGRDIGPMTSALVAGMMPSGETTKEFIGQSALEKLRGTTPRKRLVQLAVDCGSEFLYGDEPVYRNGRFAGLVTSAAYGHTVGKMLAFVYLGIPEGAEWAAIAAGEYQVEIAGTRYGAQPLQKPLYDPAGSQLRG